MVYKPTYNWGAPSCMGEWWIIFFGKKNESMSADVWCGKSSHIPQKESGSRWMGPRWNDPDWGSILGGAGFFQCQSVIRIGEWHTHIYIYIYIYIYLFFFLYLFIYLCIYLFIYVIFYLCIYIYIILNLVSGRISFPASRFWETSHRMVIPFWMVNGLDGSTFARISSPEWTENTLWLCQNNYGK